MGIKKKLLWGDHIETYVRQGKNEQAHFLDPFAVRVEVVLCCFYFSFIIIHSVSEKDSVSVFFTATPIEKESPTIGHLKYGTGS